MRFQQKQHSTAEGCHGLRSAAIGRRCHASTAQTAPTSSIGSPSLSDDAFWPAAVPCTTPWLRSSFVKAGAEWRRSRLGLATILRQLQSCLRAPIRHLARHLAQAVSVKTYVESRLRSIFRPAAVSHGWQHGGSNGSPTSWNEFTAHRACDRKRSLSRFSTWLFRNQETHARWD
jgi:hypothetical protein